MVLWPPVNVWAPVTTAPLNRGRSNRELVQRSGALLVTPLNHSEENQWSHVLSHAPSGYFFRGCFRALNSRGQRSVSDEHTYIRTRVFLFRFSPPPTILCSTISRGYCTEMDGSRKKANLGVEEGGATAGQRGWGGRVGREREGGEMNLRTNKRRQLRIRSTTAKWETRSRSTYE